MRFTIVHRPVRSALRRRFLCGASASATVAEVKDDVVEAVAPALDANRPFFISKEKMMEMPCSQFPGSIHVVTDEQSESRVFHLLRGAKVLGFDTEMRPTFTKGQARWPVTLIQIATESDVILYRCGPAATLSSSSGAARRRRHRLAEQRKHLDRQNKKKADKAVEQLTPVDALVAARQSNGFEEIGRKALQALAMSVGVKANGKSVDIAANLDALLLRERGAGALESGAAAAAVEQAAAVAAKASSASESEIQTVGELPPRLKRLLADPNVLKVGQSILGDAKLLNVDYGVKMEGCVDLFKCATVIDCNPKSLRALSAHFTGTRLSKAQQMSDWQKSVLSPAQIKYAAVDAWASLRVYNEMMLMASGPSGDGWGGEAGSGVIPGLSCTGDEMRTSLEPMQFGGKTGGRPKST